ncbi:protein MGARP [Mixophyes fleayi]|uniref:protein MGARP n=1 Tax=Mixophyes fleayi TaxID=3061075 RepID=UPI003F4E0505
MYLCRSTWQRLAPLTHRGAAAALLRNAPVRQMSSSSVPGSTGEALPYYLFLGAALTGGGVYLYRTLSSDKARFRDRHEYIQTQLRPTLEANSKITLITMMKHLYSNPLKGEEAAESVIEEAAVEEITEQEVVVTEEEAPPASTEQEPAPSSEAATVQEEQDVIDPAVESSDVETSPLLEANSDNIPEDLASAAEEAEDWAELSARKPEEAVEENSPAAQESDEVVESEQAAASS